MGNSNLNRIFLALAAIVIVTMLFSTVEAVTVALTSPADEGFTDDTTPDFTFEITDFTVDVTCDLLINGSNYGNEDVTDNGSYTITANTDLSEGTFTWNVDCNGDSASQDWEINVDSTNPTVTLTSPDNDEVFSSANRRPDFTFTPDDNMADYLDCDLYIDDATQAGWSATVDSGDSETISLSQDVEWGEHDWYIECTDEAGNTRKSSTRTLYMGGLIIKDVDLSEDKVKPGEEIEIDVEIENIMDELDVEDVDVNIENDDLDIDEEETINEIKDGDKETVTFTVTIDNEADEDTYTIEIRVKGEDDDGDDHEVYGETEIEVKREKHELLIEDTSFSPSKVDCGDSTELTVRIQNIGRSDEDDVYVIVENNELGIEEMSDKDFDIDTDDDYKDTISIDIPEDIEGKRYVFTVEVYYDDGDEKEIGIAELNVDCKVPVYGAYLSVDEDTLDLKPGEEGEVQITLQNSGDLETEYDITVTGVAIWSEYSVTPSEVTLNPDETVNIVLHITPKEDITEGTRTANIIAKYNGDALDSEAVEINVEEESIEPEIISEGESGETPVITGGSVLDIINNNNLAIIIAIIVVIVIVVASLTISRVPKK